MNYFASAMVAVIALLLAACGGGGGGSSSDPLSGKQTTYSVGGTLTLIDAPSGQPPPGVLVVDVSAGSNRSITLSAPGAFTFATLTAGTSYRLEVSTPPVGYGCQVVNGNGTVTNAAVNNIEVNCTANRYSLGGTVVGLGANNGGMQIANGSDVVNITGDGPFSFAPITNGAGYNVRVGVQHPNYVCEIHARNGDVVAALVGTINAAPVADIAIVCSLPIRVTVSGLGVASSGLQLTDTYTSNGASVAEPLAVSGDGVFQFNTRLSNGREYRIDVLQAHPDFDCSISNGSGVVGVSPVNVVVQCTQHRYTVGGSVTGLPSGVSLRLVDHADGSIATLLGGTSFTIGGARLNGTSYDVAVDVQPAKMRCIVVGGAGIIARVNVSGISVSCRPLVAFVYVANATGNSISQYVLEASTGVLVSMQPGTLDLNIPPSKVVMHPNGRYAYAVNTLNASIALLNVDSNTGLLSNANMATSLPLPRDMVIDASGQNAYTVGTNNFSFNGIFFSADQLTQYFVDSFSGQLTQLQRQEVGQSMGGLVTGPRMLGIDLDPTGRYAYVRTTDATWQYSIDSTSGFLTQRTSYVGSPGVAAAIHPNGRHAYLVVTAERAIRQFDIAATGAFVPMTPVASVATGAFPKAVVVDHAGRFAYVVNSDDHTISQYVIDPTTGSLTLQLPAIPTGQNPVAIAIDNTDTNVYVVNYTSESIWQYSIASSGQLTRTSLAPVTTGAGPVAITLAPVR